MSTAAPQRYSEGAYEIRHAKNHAETTPLWSRFMLELGWDRYGEDLATYLDHSKTGMLLAFPKGSNQPVGHIAAVTNENSSGWVALFIVDAPYRGYAVGGALWDKMMLDFRNVGTRYAGLDAVPAQKGTYERRGFVESTLGRIELMTRRFGNLKSLPATPSIEGLLIEVHAMPPSLLADYELRYTGFHRPVMWKSLLNRKDLVGVAVSKKHDRSSVDDILAVGVMRRCPRGARIGPIMADNRDLAATVLSSLVNAATPEYILRHPLPDIQMTAAEIDNDAVINIEVWTGQPDSLSMATALGFQSCGYYHRMWYEDRATPEQSAGGAASSGLYAIFDAAVG